MNSESTAIAEKEEPMLIRLVLFLSFCSGLLSFAGEINPADPLIDPKLLEATQTAPLMIEGKLVNIPVITKQLFDALVAKFPRELADAQLRWNPNSLQITKNIRTYSIHQMDRRTGNYSEETITAQGPEPEGFSITIDYGRYKYMGSVKVPFNFQKPYWTGYTNAFNSPDQKESVYYVIECGIRRSALQTEFSNDIAQVLSTFGWTASR